MFCDIWWNSEALVKGHTTVSQQTLSGDRRYVCESSNGGRLIFGHKVPTLGGFTACPCIPLKPQRLMRDIVPCRHRAAAFLTVSGLFFETSANVTQTRGVRRCGEFGGVIGSI
jgi:hypothetical protein